MRKDKFTNIFLNNIWGNAESISGDGSTIDYTSSIRKHLPKLITELKVKNIFDAGCGDYNWFKEIDIPKELNYTGADIVEELIVDLKDKYEQKNINFIQFDLVEDKLDKFDLVICRDVLFHLPHADKIKFLSNFVTSNSKYLLTTSSKSENYTDFKNDDIPEPGWWSPVDLFMEPFSFPTDPVYKIDDVDKYLCLWTNDQICGSLLKIEL
mgnify:FL=1